MHPFAWPRVRRGGERYLHDLHGYLTGAGHEVDAITGTEAPVPGPLARRGITRVETFGARVLPALLRRRYDVVHALTPTAAIVARATGHRTVYTVLGNPEPEIYRDRPVLLRLFRTAVRTANALTALSEPAADEVERGTGRRPLVQAPGVVTSDYAPDLAPRTGPVRILFSGALDQPQKGLDVLVRAFAVIRSTDPEARLLLSGPGDPSWVLKGSDPDVVSAIDDLGVGRVEDIPDLYRSATATVLPSRHEAFGLVLIESLATGTPVIGTFEGGAKDIVQPSVGRLVPYGDVDALVQALLECVDLARRESTSADCRAHAMRWDWSTTIGPAHESIYGHVVKRRS